MKKICHTSLFNGYDKLRDPTVLTPGWEYVVFSDQEQESDVWRTVIANENYKPRVATRLCMIEPWKYVEGDRFLSMGANYQVACDLTQYEGHEFAAVEHPSRTCFYEEAKACITLEKDNPAVILRQIAAYLDDGLPRNAGMVATGVLVRDATDNVKEHCRLWAEQILTHSFRDQLSFNYVLWKYKLIEPHLFSWNEFHHNFNRIEHLR